MKHVAILFLSGVVAFGQAGSWFAYDVVAGRPRLRSVAIREIGSRSMKQLHRLTEESLDGGGRLTYFPATRRGP